MTDKIRFKPLRVNFCPDKNTFRKTKLIKSGSTPQRGFFCPDQNVCSETHEITDKIRLKSLRNDFYLDKNTLGQINELRKSG